MQTNQRTPKKIVILSRFRSTTDEEPRVAETPPPGVALPSGNPTSVTLSGGQANFSLTFPKAGYYRVAATGPGGDEGWVTVDVGTTPATAPPQ